MFLFVTAASLLFGASSSEAPDMKVPDHAEGIFLEAARHVGVTGNDAAMVTIVDPEAHHETEACVEIDTLGWAVALEHDIAWSPTAMPRIVGLMRQNEDRRFIFHNAEALALLGKDRGYPELDEELCDLIRVDTYAYRMDRPPTLIVGRVRDR